MYLQKDIARVGVGLCAATARHCSSHQGQDSLKRTLLEAEHEVERLRSKVEAVEAARACANQEHAREIQTLQDKCAPVPALTY